MQRLVFSSRPSNFIFVWCDVPMGTKYIVLPQMEGEEARNPVTNRERGLRSYTRRLRDTRISMSSDDPKTFFGVVSFCSLFQGFISNSPNETSRVH